jgi:hypothetical protein
VKSSTLRNSKTACQTRVSLLRTKRSGVEQSVSTDPSAALGVTPRQGKGPCRSTARESQSSDILSNTTTPFRFSKCSNV